MALIVETGSIIPDADSYVSRADYIDYAAARGVMVPDEEAADVELRKAAQFIDSHEERMKGSRVDRDQPLSFPRKGVEIEGWLWGDDEIPRNVSLCQLNVAMDIHAGIDPYNPPSNPGLARKRTRVEGAIDVEFMGDGRGQKLSRTSTWESLLYSFLKRSGLTVMRA